MPYKLIHVGTNKYFVENVNTGKRYSNHPMTKRKAEQQRQILNTVYTHTGGMEGGNIFRNVYDRVSGLVSGGRNDYSPAIRELLKKIDQYDITKIQICREPVKAYVNKLVSVLTLGKMKNLQKQYGFDSLFHLYMVVDFYDTEKNMTRKIKIEKNHVINITENFTTADNARAMTVPDIPEDLTIYTFLSNAAKQMGFSYWKYDAFNRGNATNCQGYIKALLQYNNLLTPELDEFIFQDVSELTKELSPVSTGIMHGLTDMASRFDTFIHGKGLKPQKRCGCK